MFFLKKWQFPVSFSLFSSFVQTVNNKYFYNKTLPMTGFEPRTYGIGSEQSANCATTTALGLTYLRREIFISAHFTVGETLKKSYSR